MNNSESVLKAKIVSVDSIKPNKPSPIIAKFQNGIFNRVNGTSVKRVFNPETEESFALVATPESVYKGDIGNSGSSSVNTYLAFHNKTTNEVKLVQVHEGTFKHTLYDSKHSVFENNVLDAKKVLQKDFGGKRAVASYERVKKTALNFEILGEMLDTQLENIDDKAFEGDKFDQSEKDRKELQSSIFPDIDLSSGNAVRDVFTAKKLLGQGMLEHLKDVAIQVLQTEPEKLPFISKFLNESVRTVQTKKNPDSDANIERISLFIYIDALIRVINCRKKSFDKVELSRMSDLVEQDIRKKFSFQGTMSNSKFTRQKSIIYYLIMLLITTDSLQIELENVLEGVDVTRTEVLKYATVFGAKVKDKNTLYIQHAKLDKESKLSAPMPSMKKRRRN